MTTGPHHPRAPRVSVSLDLPTRRAAPHAHRPPTQRGERVRPIRVEISDRLGDRAPPHYPPHISNSNQSPSPSRFPLLLLLPIEASRSPRASRGRRGGGSWRTRAGVESAGEGEAWRRSRGGCRSATAASRRGRRRRLVRSLLPRARYRSRGFFDRWIDRSHGVLVEGSMVCLLACGLLCCLGFRV